MPDIDFQRIVLNLIPKKGDEPIVFYASQYETTRPFIADLMWGETEFAPGDDCWAEIDIRKNDDNLVIITDDVAIDNNEVSVILPVQALTCIGKNLGQVKIYAGEDQLIAALNFILEVQADPSAGGVTSETAIDNLTEQIEEITQQVIGDDYYNKTEVDGLLADKADQATTYTKSEVDTALNLKADKSDTYTKTQVDSALALKANTADLATVATTGDYDDLLNKPDIENMIADALFAVMPVGSVGPSAIASFETELAAPLQSVIVDVVATQPSGTPTPSTPLPITGYSSANITRCGMNLFDIEKYLTDNNVSYTKDSDGWYTFNTASALYGNKFSLPLNHYSGGITFDNDRTTATNFVLRVYKNGTAVMQGTTITNQEFNEVGFNWLTAGQVCIKPIINLGSTPSAYTPYNGQTYAIAFGQTVYGGVLDVTRGKLHVTHGFKDLGTLTWTNNVTGIFSTQITDLSTANKQKVKCSWYGYGVTQFNWSDVPTYADKTINTATNNYIYIKDTDYSDAPSFKTAVDGVQLVYELATPFDIDLTPEVILAIIGSNSVSSDTGDTTVSYKDSIQHYIDTRP